MSQYFDKDFTLFFKELEKNNNKVWFDANRPRYEKNIKTPFFNFIEALIDEVSKIDKDLLIDPKAAIFRINKDVRFSKDKSPYKLHCSAAIAKGGRKDHVNPGFYLEFTANKIAYYSGIYMADTKTLKSIREYISDNNDEFNKLLKDKKFKTTFGELYGEKSKVLPKEMKEIASTQPYIYNKQFLLVKEWKGSFITDKNLMKELIQTFENGRAMRAFLYEASIY